MYLEKGLVGLLTRGGPRLWHSKCGQVQASCTRPGAVVASHRLQLWFLAQDHIGEPCAAPRGAGQYGDHAGAKFMSEELSSSLEDRSKEWRIECAG